MALRHLLLIIYYVIWYLGLDAVPAFALSCRSLEDRYVLACNEARCEPRFRARDVPSHRFRPCMRHLVLEPVPTWAVPAIEQVLRTRMEQLPVGVVEVVVEYRPLSAGVSENEAWLRDALYAPGTRLRVRTAEEGEAKLRESLEQRSSDERWASRRTWALDVVVVLLISFTSLAPCVLFVRRVWKVTRRKQLRLLVSALARDTLLFIFGVFASATQLLPMAVLAVPLSVLIALVEIVVFSVACYRGRDIAKAHRLST